MNIRDPFNKLLLINAYKKTHYSPTRTPLIPLKRIANPLCAMDIPFRACPDFSGGLRGERWHIEYLIVFLVTLISFILTPSCISDWGNSISGEGDVISELRDVPAFTAVDASGGLDIYITFGNEFGVEVVADENLQEIIRTEVKGNTLLISPKISIRRASSKKVYVNVPSLDRINVSSAAKILGQNSLETEDLRVHVSSAGDIKLDVYAEKIMFDISSSGSASFTGGTVHMNIDVSSAGQLRAKELEAEDANINASSAGSAVVYVTKNLRASASSAGNIAYYGNPEKKDINTSSAGSVNAR